MSNRSQNINYDDYDPDAPPSDKEIREAWDSAADWLLIENPHPDAGVRGAIELAQKVIGGLEKQIQELEEAVEVAEESAEVAWAQATLGGTL